MARRARQLRPSSPAGHVHLCTALIELGRLDEAERAVAALEAAKQPDWATWMGALIEFTRGHLPTALERLERLRVSADPQWVSRAHTLRASWLAEAGRADDAERELRAGLEFDAGRASATAKP